MKKKFISYYKPYLGLFILDLVSALGIAGIDLLFPMFTNKLTKQYIPDGNMQMLVRLGFVLFGFYIIRMFLSFILSYWGHLMGVKIESDMRRDLFKKYQELDYQFFDDNKIGVLMSNMTNHLRDISEMSHHVPEDIFISVVLFIGSFIYLMQINSTLTLILFGLMIILIIFSVSRRRKMTSAFRSNRKFHGELNAELESSLGGIRLTKAYNNEDFEKKRFKKINEAYAHSWRKSYKQVGIFHSGNEFLVQMMNLVLLVAGGFFTYKGHIELTDLLTFFLYINFFIRPVQRLIQTMEQTQQGLSGFEKFYQIITTIPNIQNPQNGIQISPKGSIEFIDATFSYDSDDTKHILSNFNLKIEKGKKIALVGETGVGKSTISKLIPRFYDLNAGQILIDGIDVKEYDLNVLRNAIGHVQQDVYIFFGSIRDNILYGKPNATEEEIIEAAKLANIHDFIMSLEEGYDTLTGERGIKLSGGQKQRISIARLFLKNPPILILDEATSSLDNITEHFIQESLDKLSKGKTTITIAHRLSTIISSDEIIVLGKEGILERGKHETLIHNNGYYAKLYKNENQKLI